MTSEVVLVPLTCCCSRELALALVSSPEKDGLSLRELLFTLSLNDVGDINFMRSGGFFGEGLQFGRVHKRALSEDGKFKIRAKSQKLSCEKRRFTSPPLTFVTSLEVTVFILFFIAVQLL